MMATENIYENVFHDGELKSVLITGCPGTGKTTLVKNILNSFFPRVVDVVVVAPGEEQSYCGLQARRVYDHLNPDKLVEYMDLWNRRKAKNLRDEESNISAIVLDNVLLSYHKSLKWLYELINRAHRAGILLIVATKCLSDVGEPLAERFGITLHCGGSRSAGKMYSQLYERFSKLTEQNMDDMVAEADGVHGAYFVAQPLGHTVDTRLWTSQENCVHQLRIASEALPADFSSELAAWHTSYQIPITVNESFFIKERQLQSQDQTAQWWGDFYDAFISHGALVKQATSRDDFLLRLLGPVDEKSCGYVAYLYAYDSYFNHHNFPHYAYVTTQQHNDLQAFASAHPDYMMKIEEQNATAISWKSFHTEVETSPHIVRELYIEDYHSGSDTNLGSVVLTVRMPRPMELMFIDINTWKAQRSQLAS